MGNVPNGDAGTPLTAEQIGRAVLAALAEKRRLGIQASTTAPVLPVTCGWCGADSADLMASLEGDIAYLVCQECGCAKVFMMPLVMRAPRPRRPLTQR